MRVFLCWSGERSRELAVAFRDWVKPVIQELDPWMSEEDIEKGSVWSTKIAGELKESSFGILFITPENLNSVWVHFEAGALSKTFANESYVCPYLLDVQWNQVKGPLTLFQHTQATKTDTRRLMGTLNNAIGERKLAEKTLDKSFRTYWPDLETELTRIREIKIAKKLPTRPDSEMLDEILTRVRTLATRPDLEESLLRTLSLLGLPSMWSPSLLSGPPTTIGSAATRPDYSIGANAVDYPALTELLRAGAPVATIGDNKSLVEAYRKGVATGSTLVSGGDSSTLTTEERRRTAEKGRRIGAELTKILAKSDRAKKGKPRT